MQCLQIHRWLVRRRSRCVKHISSALLRLPLPFRIWFGCISFCCASSASVFSPFTAARATFALNAAECVRGVLFVISLVPFQHYRWFRPRSFHLPDCPNSRGHLCQPHGSVPFRSFACCLLFKVQPRCVPSLRPQPLPHALEPHPPDQEWRPHECAASWKPTSC